MARRRHMAVPPGPTQTHVGAYVVQTMRTELIRHMGIVGPGDRIGGILGPGDKIGDVLGLGDKIGGAY